MEGFISIYFVLCVYLQLQYPYACDIKHYHAYTRRTVHCARYRVRLFRFTACAMLDLHIAKSIVIGSARMKSKISAIHRYILLAP